MNEMKGETAKRLLLRVIRQEIQLVSYKTSEILLIYYKESCLKGVIKHEAYMRRATRHIQGRHEATLITRSE